MGPGEDGVSNKVHPLTEEEHATEMNSLFELVFRVEYYPSDSAELLFC